MPESKSKVLSRSGWRATAVCAAFAMIGAMTLAVSGIAQEAAPDAPDSASPGAEEVTGGGQPQNVAEAQAELERIKSSITISRDRADALRTDIEKLAGDREQQNAALIAAAQRVKLAEIEANAAEERLSELITRENAIRERLAGADADIAGLLGALQRISRTPPPALLVQPGDALDSARGATLLSDVLPQLRDKADAVAADLAELREVRESAEAEEETLRENLSNLMEEQLRTATLIEARKRGIARKSDALESEEQRAEQLAEEAESLEALIADLKAEIESVSDAAAAADAQAGSDSALADLDEQAIRTAFADTSRTEPAVPFRAAQGFLTRPASGVVVNQFGSDDGFGGTAHGISMVTRAEAQVVAPADSWVMYKGPYLNYGEIVILNPGQDYSIVLAGLDSIGVQMGQFVMMGEPVGTMGSRTVGRAVSTSAGVSRPTLYIELREQNTPLDPAKWWADTDNRTQSG